MAGVSITRHDEEVRHEFGNEAFVVVAECAPTLLEQYVKHHIETIVDHPYSWPWKYREWLQSRDVDSTLSVRWRGWRVDKWAVACVMAGLMRRVKDVSDEPTELR